MEIYKKIKESIIGMEPEQTADLIKQALAEGLDPMEILNKGMVAGIEVVGEAFKSGDLFLRRS